MPLPLRPAAGIGLGLLLCACAYTSTSARTGAARTESVAPRWEDRPTRTKRDTPRVAAPPTPTVPSAQEASTTTGPASPRPALPATPLHGDASAAPSDAKTPAPTRDPGAAPPRVEPLATSPQVPATAPSASTPTPAPSAPSSAAAPYPVAFAPFIARLREDAMSGRDRDLAASADLLQTIERSGLEASSETTIVRVPELEAQARVAYGRGTQWATLTTWREAGGDADAISAVYLDLDRVSQWTGKASTRAISRSAEGVLGETDAVRRVLALEFGARWRFLARPLDRGNARVIASSMVPFPETNHMQTTHGIVIAFPEGDSVRVVEVTTMSVDIEVPRLLRDVAIGSILREMHARAAGIRGHWREYVGRR